MREDNFVGAKVDHVSFHRDAIIFDFTKTNTDQEGIKNIGHPWHVYTDTLEPVVLPLLALAWYIITHP